MIRRMWLAVWMALAAPAWAQGELVFAVTEGVTYQATPKEIRDKFAPVADAIARATGRKVRTVLVPAYNDVRAGLAKHLDGLGACLRLVVRELVAARGLPLALGRLLLARLTLLVAEESEIREAWVEVEVARVERQAQHPRAVRR